MSINIGQYEERIVAFIDILGFREHVKESSENNIHFLKIRNVLDSISSLKNENDDSVLKEFGKEVTVFSDSIVISYKVGDEGAVFNLLQEIIHLQIAMLTEGIIMRGGITVGELYHRDNVVFGPAMIEAYEMESKIAVYPRVIINLKVLKIASENSFNSPEEDLEYIFNLIEMDFDELLFVDFLSQFEEIHWESDYRDLLEIAQKIILDNIEKTKKQNYINVKYKWLKRYFNNVLDNANNNLYLDLKIK